MRLWNVQVSGVSLALLAYDARQPAQAQAAAARPAAAGPSSSAAGGAVVPPIAGIGRAPDRLAGAAPRAEQPLRLRKRVRMAVGSARRGAPQSAASAGPSPPADAGPVAEHVLLQQWGFSLDARVVPPLWGEGQQSSAADSGRGLRSHHSHLGAEAPPVHAAEEASTPSTSDTGVAPALDAPRKWAHRAK